VVSRARQNCSRMVTALPNPQRSAMRSMVWSVVSRRRCANAIRIAGLGTGIGFDLSMTPGKILDVPVGETALLPGRTGHVFSRDFRIHVQDCAGPLTIQAYSIITAEGPGVIGNGAVFGDPIVS
jgi:hypothetical protein